MALDCLDGLVGLANRDCPCVSGGQPSGWNDSETGYYLDDREYGFPVKSAQYANLDCGEDSIWDTLAEARTQAVRDVKNDLLQALESTRESKVMNWRGLIGKAEGTGSYVTGNTYAGIQIRPRLRLKDAYFVVKALWINIDATKSVMVGIASNDPTQSTYTQSASCAANTWTRVELTTVQSLPLYSINQSDLRYHVYYEPDGARGRYNRLWCCSKPPWMEHLDAGAFNQAALPVDDTIPTGTDCVGFAIEGYFTCNKLDWICDLEEMNGLNIRDLIGRMIQFKGAIHLITGVLRSDKVNKYTLLDQEGLYRQRSHLQKLYGEYALWVAQNLPGGVTSCWGCDKYAPAVSSLII